MVVAANTALPQPPSTSQNVPISSAASRWNRLGADIVYRLCHGAGICAHEGYTPARRGAVGVAKLCRERDHRDLQRLNCGRTPIDVEMNTQCHRCFDKRLTSDAAKST